MTWCVNQHMQTDTAFNFTTDTEISVQSNSQFSIYEKENITCQF